MATISRPPPPRHHSRNRLPIAAVFTLHCPPLKSASLFSPHTKPFTISASSTPDSSNSHPKPPAAVDPVKLAFEKAKAYKKSPKTSNLGPTSKNPNPVLENGSSAPGDYVSVKMALERAGVTGIEEANAAGHQKLSGGNGDKKAGKKNESSVSSIDFMGLNFADKKKGRGLPAGLMPVMDPMDVPDSVEVEFIAGDISKFNKEAVSERNVQVEEGTDFYKPKVSTWGVFPRPANISETFGGGKTIRPGDVLETKEDRAAKEAKTRELLAAYKARVGVNIDPKLKAECEKAVNDGDYLMDRGKLKEALPFYEDVMKKLAFKTELHGVAALQWSICQDSLSRSNEAKIMYEKLQSHPNYRVSKAAKEFMFSFQAMEMMKVKNARTPSVTSGYQNYFEAFLENKPDYALKDSEAAETEDTETINNNGDITAPSNGSGFFFW